MSDAASAATVSYQACGCGHVWYFARTFCPSCGNRDVATRVASGEGRVHAVTVVERAPTADMRALAPYTIVLVDATEGFRMMAHAEPGIAIGDPVATAIETIADRPIPVARRQRSS